MSAIVLAPGCADDERDAVHRAVDALAAGKLVAFPTETVYGVAANAMDESAVVRLLEAKGRESGNPLPLAVRSADQATECCPSLSAVANRLACRCWPGPLTLVVDTDTTEGIADRLTARVRQAVMPNGTIGLRVPGHRYILSSIKRMGGPLVLTSANRSGEADAVCAEEAVEALGDDVELVLSDGRSKYGQPSTVVRVVGNQLQVLRHGALSESALRRSASLVALVVCTGNTCRSPMTQVLLQKRIADKLGCSVGEVEDHGVIVRSAGVAGMSGGGASAEAVRAMSQRSLELSEHETRPVTDVLVRQADIILTMTRGHRDAIVAQWPEAVGKTSLLHRDGGDIADPIGGATELYVHCADQIDTHLRDWMEDIDWESIPKFKDTTRE